MNSCVDFIHEKKEMFFHWLYRTQPYHFPRVCEYASDVLGCWLYHHYPNESILIQSGLFDGWCHSWLEINNQVVDFTVTQFLGGKDQHERDDLLDHEFFKLYFESYLPSPFIDGELLDLYKFEEGLFLCQWDIALSHKKKGLSFEDYLEAIAKI